MEFFAVKKIFLWIKSILERRKHNLQWRWETLFSYKCPNLNCLKLLLMFYKNKKLSLALKSKVHEYYHQKRKCLIFKPIHGKLSIFSRWFGSFNFVELWKFHLFPWNYPKKIESYRFCLMKFCYHSLILTKKGT